MSGNPFSPTHSPGEGSSEANQYLTFWVDQQLYGVPINHVVQIVGVHKIVSMPEYPNYAKGIINLRGEIIPVIDMRIRFAKDELAYNERTCIVVVKINHRLFGLIVDAVDEVSNIHEGEITSTPEMTDAKQHRFVRAIGLLQHAIVLLLNVEELIHSGDIQAFAS